MRRDFLIYVVLEELFKKFRMCVARSALKFEFRRHGMGRQIGPDFID